MKLSEFLDKFKAFTGDVSTKLAAKDETIKGLETRLAKIEAADDSDNEKLDDVLEQLREILNEQAADSDDSDSDDKDSDSDSDSDDNDSDSDSDNSDDDNDETDAKAAAKQSKVKAVAAKTKKLVAQHKALKASVPKKIISTIAAMGIPEPVKTKVEGSTATTLKGLDRVAAAFAEQLKK